MSRSKFQIPHRLSITDSDCSISKRLVAGLKIDGNGCVDKYGYGKIHVNGRIQRCHRVMYALVVGDIPAGLTIDHLCTVRGCCNPGHLELVTFEENLERRYSRVVD